MSTRKITFVLLVLSLIGSGVGYLMTNSYQFNLCNSDVVNKVFDVSCHGFYERIGDPLWYGMPALALVFFVLLFVPSAFQAWKKFAIWFVPLATLLFIFYPSPGSGDYFSPYPKQIFQWVSCLYVIVSAIIIIAKSRPHNLPMVINK